MRKILNIALTLGSITLAACASTKTYKDAATYNGKNYVFDVTWKDQGLTRTTFLSINNTLVLTIDREAVKEAGCEKTSFYVIRCDYDAEFEGNKISVVAESDGQIGQQNTYYSISFNGSLVERITVPLM